MEPKKRPGTRMCTVCGAQLEADAGFCTVCGAKVAPMIDVVEENRTKTCSVCGSEVTQDQKFCMKCGSKVEE